MAIPQPLTGEEYRFAVAFTKAIAYLQTTAYTNRPNTAYKDLHPQIVAKAEEGQEPAYWNLLPGKNYEDAIILANPLLADTTKSEEWCILPTAPRNDDKLKLQRATEKAKANEVVFDLEANQQVRKPTRRKDPREVAEVLAKVGAAISFIIVFLVVVSIFFAITQH
jgi:hypothetical protein